MDNATPSIQVHILAGRGAGKRVLVSDPSITFGRSANCSIIVDLPHVSREHAALKFEDGDWWLVNYSPNGTQLGRKNVRNKPLRVTAGEVSVIAIGGEAICEVTPQVVAQPTDAEDAEGAGAAAGATGPGMTRRAKLWVGIGIYLLVMLGLAIFFSTLRSSDENQSVANVEAMSQQSIRDEIREPLPARPPEPARMREYLDIADQELALEASEPDALFRANEAYRLAAAYAGDDGFTDPLHERQAFIVEDRLVAEVTAQYERAFNLLQARQYGPAADAYRKLLAIYPADSDSELRRHIERQLAQAKAGMERRR